MQKVLALAAISLMVSACSLHTPGGPLEVWKNYGTARLSTDGLTEEQALAVFYRQNNIPGPAVNVYINGDYQASLLENSFTPMTVCANKQLFSTSLSTNKKFGNRIEGVRYALPSKQIVYIKMVAGKDGQPTFERVTEEVAQQDMAGLRKVTQTLPRTKTAKCDDIVLDNISLSAGALFGLDKSGYDDILPNGKEEIADFADKLTNLDQSKIGKVVVSGYTDPEASEAYNLALSQKRANAVRYALEKSGVTNKIEAVGYGETELVVNHCHSIKNKVERAVCNQPNRRVEITVYANK